MATIRDVAKHAGVSVSTVSYALSGVRPISEQTQARISAAIEELGFYPNILARGLKSKRTKVIALVIPSQSKSLGDMEVGFITGVAEAARKAEVGLLLWTTPNDDKEIVRLTQEGLVDGTLLMEIRMHDPRVQMLLERGAQFTMIGRCRDNTGLSYVDFDFRQATRLAVQCLAENGHREIALFNSAQEALAAEYGPAVRNLEAFQEIVEEMGLRGIVCSCEPSTAARQASIEALLTEHPKVRAGIISDGRQYQEVIQGLRFRGIRIPDDFSVIATVEPRIAEIITPPLTTIDFPTREMAQVGVDILLRQLEGRTGGPTQVVLQPTLAVRRSVGRAPAGERDGGEGGDMS